MRKIFTSLVAILFLCGILSCAVVEKARPIPQNIVFLGDSITHGGSYLAGPVSSYRYQVFKIFVDNDLKFFPMGTVRGTAKNTDVSHLTLDYCGKHFVNVSEAASSQRTYQHSGHAGTIPGTQKNYRPDPKTAFPEKNRGPVMLKLGFCNPFIEDVSDAKDSFYDGGTLKKYTGDTYPQLYGNTLPDTLCILIGINDLFDEWESHEKIADHVKTVVQYYQQYNPEIRVHIFEVLPTGKDNPTGTKGKNNYDAYNQYLRSQVAQWSTARSRVTCDAIDAGFFAEDGSMLDTSRGAHPNAQGELVLAGNIARALGLPQRNAALPRCLGKNFPQVFHPEFKSAPILWENEFSCGEDGEFSASISFKMRAAEAKENFLTLNFETATGERGRLLLSESGIYWNERSYLLYGSKPSAREKKIFSERSHTIRLVKKGATQSAPGFYIWLDGQLIGEALSAQKGNSTKNKFFAGTLPDTPCEGEISALSFAPKAFAPQN